MAGFGPSSYRRPRASSPDMAVTRQSGSITGEAFRETVRLRREKLTFSSTVAGKQGSGSRETFLRRNGWRLQRRIFLLTCKAPHCQKIPIGRHSPLLKHYPTGRLLVGLLAFAEGNDRRLGVVQDRSNFTFWADRVYPLVRASLPWRVLAG